MSDAKVIHLSDLTVFCHHWRESMGFSLRQAGEALHLSDPGDTFHRYERGVKEPAAPTVQLMNRIEDIRDALKQLLEGDLVACEQTLRRALPQDIGLE